MITQTVAFALAVTLICYEAAEALFRGSGKRAVFNPLLWAVLFVVPCLLLSGIDYPTYFSGTQFIHFLLGPATVALAVPLYEQRHRVKSAIVPLVGATVAGAVTSIGITTVALYAAGAGKAVIVSCAPKSVTTPVAVVVAEQQGGITALTATVVLLTGIFGAVTAPGVLTTTGRILGRRSDAAKGFELGMCAHGAGTARAFQDGNEAGAFGGLAIALHALATAIIIPVAVKAFGM